ncbi:predicted protein, partial [Nematostella vectensis]
FFSKLFAAPKAGDAPSLSSQLMPVEVTEGNDIDLVCKVSVNPKPTVTWYKGDALVKLDDRISAHFDGRFSRLSIQKATKDDEGIYICDVQNELGKAFSKVELTVRKRNVKPQIVGEIKDAEEVERGEVRFEVRVTGFPKPRVEWYRGPVHLTDGGRFSISEKEDMYSLTVRDLKRDDSGTYKLVAQNTVGKCDKYTLVCRVSGKPKPTITWFRDNTPVHTDNRVVASYEGSVSALELKEMKLSDAGLYKCTATNSQGSTSSSAEVTIKRKDAIPTFVVGLKETEGLESSDMRLDVKIGGFPRPTVEFYKDYDLIVDSERHKILEDGDRCSLIITNLRPEDAGTYKCVITNLLGVETSEAVIRVQEREHAPRFDVKPEFLRKVEDVTALETEQVWFEIPIQGYPRPIVEWYRGTTRIKDGGRFTISESEENDMYSLVIDEARTEDSGPYKCVASNDAGKTTALLNLDVNEKVVQPEFDKEVKPIEVKHGEEATTSLEIKGKPKPKVTWYKDGKVLRESKNIQLKSIGDTYSIRIVRTAPEDVGTYMCEATNKAGLASRKFDITIKGRFRCIKLHRESSQ